MFKKTYGMMYEQNSYLFQDLFRDLEKYYDTGNTNIIEVLENFFSVLCQKMFTVMNSQFTFDTKWVIRWKRMKSIFRSIFGIVFTHVCIT